MTENTELSNGEVADLMRSLGGKESDNIRKKLQENLRIALEILAEIIDQWNDACEDGDRGRCENGLALIIYDDGSGRIGTTFAGGFNSQIEFDDILDATAKLAEWF